VGQVQSPQGAALLVVLLYDAQAADGHQLLGAQVQLARRHELLLRFYLEVLRQRLAQLRRLLNRALLEDLLLLGGDVADALEQPVALLGKEDLLTAKLLPGKLAEGFFGAENLIDKRHCFCFSAVAWAYRACFCCEYARASARMAQ